MKQFVWQKQSSLQILVSAALIFLFLSFMHTQWGFEFRERVISPLEFLLRKKMGREQTFSSQLKVLVYGDKARREFGVQELVNIRRWADLIAHIAERKPRAIVFDKMFSFTLGSETDVAYFRETLKRVEAPVIAAGTFNQSAVATGDYSADRLAQWTVEETSHLLSGQLSRLHGPDRALRDSFFAYGGIQLSHASTVQPAWLDLESGRLLPQLGLSFLQKATLNAEQVEVDGLRLPLDRFARLPVQFLDRALAYKNFLPIASVFRLGASSPVLSQIKNGDVVLVLPYMYTGSTDFKNSPLGRLEGGLYHASVMNTVLTKNPIHPILQGIWPGLILMTLLAAVACKLTHIGKFRHSVALVAFVTIAMAALGLLGFVYDSIQSDWHIYSSFFLVYGGILLSGRAIDEEKQSERVEMVLEGLVAKDVVQSIKKKPDVLNIRPSEQSMTVVFIDIEGFSLRTKHLSPEKMFSVLHEQIDAISKIVLNCGGVVDRVLGDGMLCFFGFSFEKSDSSQKDNHAVQALACAIEIQRHAVIRSRALETQGDGIVSAVPLRIGLCSGDTFVGNMGSGQRIDLTIIGHTVNMAKRYEDACETFRVLMSQSTHDELLNSGQMNRFDGVRFYPRFMALKHHLELVSAWECDPFAQEQGHYQAAISQLQGSAQGVQSIGTFKPAASIRLTINDSFIGRMSECDERCFFVISDTYFCRKVNLAVSLSSDSEDLDVQLAVANLKTLYFQVVSGSALGEQEFVHELLLLHLSSEKRAILRRLLSQ